MKRLLTLLTAALCVACSSDEISSEITPEYGEGRISLGVSASTEVEIVSKSRAASTVEIPSEYIPETDDFSLTITGTYYDPSSETTLDFYQEYESISAYNSMESEVDANGVTQYYPPYLVAGNYTAVMEYGEGVDVENSTNAHFWGSVDFTIVARENDAEATLTVTLQNSMVMLNTTDNFRDYYAGGAKLTLSTTQQTELTIETLVEDSEEQILFVSPDTSLYLKGEGYKQDPGDGSSPKVTFSQSYIGTSVKQTLSTVVVDTGDTGGATIGVTLNDEYTSITEESYDLH